MDTHPELSQLAIELKNVTDNHRKATTVLALVVVVTCLMTMYLARFYIDESVHDAIEREGLSHLVEKGFDNVMENYETY